MEQATTTTKKQRMDLNYLRDRSHFVKWKAIEEMDKTLLSFETNFSLQGGKILWAEDVKGAHEAINKIFSFKKSTQAIYAGAPILHEIEFNQFCKNNQIQSFACDLNGQIQQACKSPKMMEDFSKEEISALFEAQENGKKLPSHFEQFNQENAIAINGASFITGDGAIITNEFDGALINASLKANTLIYVIGIEKVISSVNDLHLLWPNMENAAKHYLQANHIKFGPEENQELYVIFIDNGRSEVLKDKKNRTALYDLIYQSNISPSGSYSNKGEHKYEPTETSRGYAYYKAMQNGKYKNLSFAPLLFKPTKTVNININELGIQQNKADFDDQRFSQKSKWLLFLYKKALQSRSRLNMNSALKETLLKFLLPGDKSHLLPKFEKETFHQKWNNQFK